jgi:hypothetical protein
MSGINGDKARFHRERKQKLARRKRNEEMLKAFQGQSGKPAPASNAKRKTESE